jgi:deoxyribodipyrimidine photo-lyase
MKTLFLFTNDLRVHDNLALLSARHHASELALLYCFDPTDTKPNQYGFLNTGPFRQQAIEEALFSLSNELKHQGQQLQCVNQSLYSAVCQLIKACEIQRVVRTKQAGFYEQRIWQSLILRFPHVRFDEIDNHSLYHQSDIHALLHHWPDTFSKFHRQLNGLNVIRVPPQVLSNSWPKAFDPSAYIATTPLVSGPNSDFNSSAAKQRLTHFMSDQTPHLYKQTRNELAGDLFCTKLSAYLALGTLSVRDVVYSLTQYEEQFGQSNSSQWILYELLWREYFFWLAYKFQHRLFTRTGIQQRHVNLSFYPERLTAWYQGTTQWPLVNACMQELKQTGWLSNRGRQIVASCLVNELGVDWRYGAAYFQQQLIDYEVGSNWGNWQYIAGVGTDPKGGRHFNLAYQTEQYDADGEYRKHWLAEEWQTEWTYQNSWDYHGWPISS